MSRLLLQTFAKLRHFRSMASLLASFFIAWSWSSPALAEKADRSKPMVVEADQGGTVDLQRQILVYRGNVVISQGTMVLRADRIELRETADGYRTALASGAAGKPAVWRQKRDGVDETMEGSAESIEFDGKADTLRFKGNSSVRRLRAGTVADEIIGDTILWNNSTEVFRVEGGASTAVNPSGRVRAVLSPRIDAGASAPGTGSPAAGTTPATPGSLSPSRSLTPGR
jgi:lipopolysaccharide export system protein LptA